MARKLTKEEALQQFNEMEILVETSLPIKLSNILLGFLYFGLVVIALGALPDKLTKVIKQHKY